MFGIGLRLSLTHKFPFIEKKENLTAHQRIFYMVISVPIKDCSTFLTKITKYNRAHCIEQVLVTRLCYYKC